MEIGMDCRVSDPEKKSSIQIHQGNREMVTITSGCSIKSNDSRLSISCIETEDAILISVNMSGYDYSDPGNWNCSDGKSYATVAFPDFIDYPTQPVIKTQTFSSTSDQGLLELTCSSESRTQPVFSRRPLSYHWNVNQLNTSNTLTCFRRKGSRLTLCPESCRLKLNSSISVTCTVEEDGLISNESEPFIIRLVIPLVPVEQLINTTQVSMSAKYKDQTGGHSTEALIGICLGCLVAGSVLSVFLTLLFIRRSAHWMKDGEGERNSGDRDEACYINSVVNSGVRTSETEISRQYEMFDQHRMENLQSQYTVKLSEGSGQTNEAEIYENLKCRTNHMLH
ncbi:hypothetical protein ACJMK2_030403 [Sinanodonta woodiana]|uniref:Ig-like domain-containing protein n=1 Tax=Sinanodonta woodiana TaxID=1069815 RepID=A0ABD3XGT4_SINWO